LPRYRFHAAAPAAAISAPRKTHINKKSGEQQSWTVTSPTAPPDASANVENRASGWAERSPKGPSRCQKKWKINVTCEKLTFFYRFFLSVRHAVFFARSAAPSLEGKTSIRKVQPAVGAVHCGTAPRRWTEVVRSFKYTGRALSLRKKSGTNNTCREAAAGFTGRAERIRQGSGGGETKDTPRANLKVGG
jgi:hypothetical protein